MPLQLSLCLLLASTLALGCVQTTDETWLVRSAPTPEGWPEPTPVGEVRLVAYPLVRAARVDEDAGRRGTSALFRTLFRHIERNDIAMTAPVAMEYGPGAEEPRSMAFLYRSTETGGVGEQGAVRVEDVAARTFVSIGVRGGYSSQNFRRALERLDAWLVEHGARWERDGAPRYLGYNGPFVPPPLRYGEVQVPLRSRR